MSHVLNVQERKTNMFLSLKATHFNFRIFFDKLQLIILYLGLSQYYAESLVHGRVDLELGTMQRQFSGS